MRGTVTGIRFLPKVSTTGRISGRCMLSIRTASVARRRYPGRFRAGCCGSAPNQAALPYARMHTFFDGPEQPVTHIDFTRPYCEELDEELIRSAAESGVPLIDGGVYAATQGPSWRQPPRLTDWSATHGGCDRNAGSGTAREMGLCYASIAVVANWAAGRRMAGASIRVRCAQQRRAKKVQTLLAALVRHARLGQSCAWVTRCCCNGRRRWKRSTRQNCTVPHRRHARHDESDERCRHCGAGRSASRCGW